MKNKKTKIISIVAIIALALTLITATFAYFQAQTGEGSQTDIKINASTVDTLSFETGSAISLTMDQESFASGKGSATGTTFAKAILTANNKTNTATDNYNLFLNISDNNFKYTDSATYPELLLTIKDGSNNEVTSISGLEYKTVTDGKGASISGFDITTKTGLITLLSNRSITTTSSKTDTWNITITFVNYDKDQSANAGKSFSGQVLISKDSFEDYTPNTINTLSATKSGSNLTVNLNIDQGSNEIDKYYYAIEEKSAVAYTNTSNIKMLASTLSSSSINYIESTSSSYTFTNIDASKNYNVYAYAIDKKNVKSNTYEYNFYSDSYVYPVINKVETSTTSNSIKITVTATKGTNNISKYYYSIDGGNSFIESTSNNYVFNNLSEGNYRIIVKIMDTSQKYSNVYVIRKNISRNLIKFKYLGTEYLAEPSMTLAEWAESDYNTFGYYTYETDLIEKNMSYEKNLCSVSKICIANSETNGVTLSYFSELNLKTIYKSSNYNAIGKVFGYFEKNETCDFDIINNYANSLNQNQQNALKSFLNSGEVSNLVPTIFVHINTTILTKDSDGYYLVTISSESIKDQSNDELELLVIDETENFVQLTFEEYEPETGTITLKAKGDFAFASFLRTS